MAWASVLSIPAGAAAGYVASEVADSLGASSNEKQAIKDVVGGLTSVAVAAALVDPVSTTGHGIQSAHAISSSVST